MEEIEHAKIEVRAAAGNAGDASGSADEAAYLFERGDIAEAADKMKFAREQAEKAMRCAAQAEWRLRRLITLTTANVELTGVPSFSGTSSDQRERG